VNRLRALGQAILVAGMVVGAAAGAGFAVRVFMYTSGLGG
jgi:hypothetical protein